MGKIDYVSDYSILNHFRVRSNNFVKLNVLQQSKAKYEKVKKEQPYVDRDVFSKRFPGYNKLDGTIVDPYHEYANYANDTRALIFNVEKTGQHWKVSRRTSEHDLGRFKNMGAKAGWHVKPESAEKVAKLLKSDLLKYPNDWPDISNFVIVNRKKMTYMKIAERMACFAHRGLYTLGTEN